MRLVGPASAHGPRGSTTSPSSASVPSLACPRTCCWTPCPSGPSLPTTSAMMAVAGIGTWSPSSPKVTDMRHITITVISSALVADLDQTRTSTAKLLLTDEDEQMLDGTLPGLTPAAQLMAIVNTWLDDRG